MDGYLGVTAHYINDKWEMKRLMLACVKLVGSHTAIHLREALLEELNRFNLQSATVAAIHDNAPNMLAMTLPFSSIRCIAHTVQLSVRAGLDEVKTLVDRVRLLVMTLGITIV